MKRNYPKYQFPKINYTHKLRLQTIRLVKHGNQIIIGVLIKERINEGQLFNAVLSRRPIFLPTTPTEA